MEVTCVGGKTGWPPAPRRVLKPSKSVFEEPTTPLRNDSFGRIQPGRNLYVRQAIRGIQDHPRSHHTTILSLLLARSLGQFLSLRIG
jgi:hypothetical protein